MAGKVKQAKATSKQAPRQSAPGPLATSKAWTRCLHTGCFNTHTH